MKTLALDNSEQAFILYNALLEHKDKRTNMLMNSIQNYEKNGEPWEGVITEYRVNLNKYLDAIGPVENRLREIVLELLA